MGAETCPNSKVDGHFAEAGGEEVVPGRDGMGYACCRDRKSLVGECYCSRMAELVASGLIHQAAGEEMEK